MPGKQGSNLFATVILDFWPCSILFLLFSDIVSDSGQAALRVFRGSDNCCPGNSSCRHNTLGPRPLFLFSKNSCSTFLCL